ncbi:hypothetical protein [Trinickia fusca]|uniref:hypothetical protein n=1 Tax=Trinickia fusca TaxID=2419777 RepID=UPI0011C48C34|nr:hypothetical protein [Trinickia fusca]
MIKAKRPGIDVSVVLFYKSGSIPPQLNVRDVTLPLARRMPGYITGLSGHQRMESMMYARQHADAKRLEMIVIDLLVGFELPLYPKVLPPELVKEHDVLNLFRASKELIACIADYWQQWVVEDEGQRAKDRYEWTKPADFVARRPDLLPRLFELEEFDHIHVVTHPVITAYHDKPLTATSFRIDHPLIERASARFHPDIEVLV